MLRAWNRVQRVPEILHALSQPLQQELDVLCNVLVIVLLLLKVLQLLQHLALNHGQGILLPGLPLCRLLQEILSWRGETTAGSALLTVRVKAIHFEMRYSQPTGAYHAAG